LLDILEAAGQDQRLVLFIEGLMFRQMAMDGNADLTANALTQSSLLWQSLYLSLQSGVMFVKRRAGAPPFKLPPREATSRSKSPLSSKRNSLTNLLRGRHSSVDMNAFVRTSGQSMGFGTGALSAFSRRSSIANGGGSSRRSSVAGGGHISAGGGEEAAGKLAGSLSNAPDQQKKNLQRRRSFVDLS
jgi:hypothetical protein